MIEFILAKVVLDSFDDYLFKKSLERVVPDLEQLQQDPQKVLKTREIIIGPRKRYCTASFIGLVWAFAGLGLCYLSLLVLPRLLGLGRIKDC